MIELEKMMILMFFSLKNSILSYLEKISEQLLRIWERWTPLHCAEQCGLIGMHCRISYIFEGGKSQIKSLG